jgi:hypothetical protein
MNSGYDKVKFSGGKNRLAHNGINAYFGHRIPSSIIGSDSQYKLFQHQKIIIQTMAKNFKPT